MTDRVRRAGWLAGAALVSILPPLAMLSAERAGAQPAKAAGPPEFALVPADGLGFIHIKVADLWTSAAGKKLQKHKDAAEVIARIEKTLGAPIAEVERVTIVARTTDEGLLTLVALGKPAAKEKILAVLVPQAESQKVGEKVLYTSKQPGTPAVHFIDDRLYAIGGSGAVRSFVERRGAAKTEGPLAPALAQAAGKHHLVAGVALNEKVVREWEDGVRKARGQDLIGQTMIRSVDLLRPLVQLQTATLAADFAEETQVHLRMMFPNDAGAEKGLAAARDGIELLQLVTNVLIAEIAKQANMAETRDHLRQIEAAFAAVRFAREGKVIDVNLRARLQLATLASAAVGMTSAQSSIGRRQSQRNLSEIGLALHTYHNDFNTFPAAAITDKDGKPLLSWRVAILPYLEQNLFNQFKHDEPWDSPHNKALLKHMPRIYGPPGLAGGEPVGTYYQAFVGTGAAFELTEKLSVAKFRDGTHLTIMIAEASEPVPWTKPEDLPYDDKKPLPKVGGTLFKDGFHALFGDRSIQFIKSSIDEATLRRLITRSDGEVIDFRQFVK